jgi:hypothetical protein
MGSVSVRRVFATCAAACVLTASEHADAWYFPEHVVVTKDALTQLPPEIRAVLATAIARARAEGLPLCAHVDVGLDDVARTQPLTTRMLRAEKGVDCIPYAALPAIGGDHADGADELRKVLSTAKGAEITTAAAYQWGRFLEAVEKLPNAPIERMSFVHALDVDFYYIDPGYEVRASTSRAHFVDAGIPLAATVRNAAVAGAVDNAVGQFVAHHLRSLQLASRGQASEAILAHGLSLHFLEDAFASGHLVMNENLWARGNTHARHRHDFFNARSLHVRRALSAEPCTLLQQSVESFGGPLPCWTATGDGYLSVGADATDRVHVTHAVKKTEMELAIAFDPTGVVQFVEGLGEREQIAVGELIDPMPWWTLPPRARRIRPSTAARHAMDLVQAAASAVEKLRASKSVPPIVVRSLNRFGLFDARIAEDALDPCARSERDADPDKDENADADPDECGPGRRVALGSIGASFLRPILVELPAADTELSTLEGQAMTDHGMAVQLFAATGMNALFPPRSPIDFFAPSLGASMGLAYRFGTYLPGRQNRSVVELGLGINVSLHVDARRRAGGHPTVTMLEQELRWPILWELLTSYVRPFDLRASHSAGSFILLGGIRVREMLMDPSPRFWGVELEMAAIELFRGIGAYPLYGGSIEARFHLGLANPSVAQPLFPTSWGPTLGITLTSGYSTFL